MGLLAQKGRLSWSGRESNRVFLNLGGGKFSDISGLTNADWLQDGRACARLDWDEDGRQDLVLRNRNAPRVRLMLNRWPRPGNWLQVDLVGTACNRDAVGAQVRVEVEDRVLRGSVRVGEGFLSASSKRLHFGLGSASEVSRVQVKWPGGGVEEFSHLAVNQRLRIVQGAGTPVIVPSTPAVELLGAVPEAAQPAADHRIVRVPLTQRLPMSQIPLPSWDNPDRVVADLAGSPLLINFWSSTCGECLTEFDVLQKRQLALARTNLKIVPILVEDGYSPESARTLLATYGLDRFGGVADEHTKAALAAIFEEVLFDSEDMPLPCSLLLDRMGQLTVIYLGPVRYRELAADLDLVARLPLNSVQETELSGGNLLFARLRDFEGLARRFTEIGLPKAAAEYQRYQAEMMALTGR